MTTHDHHNRICAACGDSIAEPYAHCVICEADYCLACGTAHFCNETCFANGCIPGKCTKVINAGKPATTWGVPPQD